MSLAKAARNRLLVSLGILALFAAACSEPATETTDSTSTTTVTAAPTDDTTPNTPDPVESVPEGDGTSIVERLAGEEWFLGTIPDLPVEADTTLEPIKIGIINQEDSPAGSFPELRFAADAAVNFINAELGGVEGRPIELFPCATNFSVESSQGCAQELVLEEVVALVGGLDVLASGALPVLEQNGLPIVGGIPAGLAEQRSPSSFAFSGGTSGGMAAMMQHAADQGYKKAFIAYGDFESFKVAAEEYGARVAESLGMEVRLNAFPLFGADYTRVLNDAKAFGAEAVVINAADTACVPVMQGFRDLGFEGTLYMFGSCAAEHVIAEADGANFGVVFNSEGPPNADDIEGQIFDFASNEYNNGDAQAAGTVAFRGMMNLYAILIELGADNITSAGIVDALQNSVDRESFWGHNYTCDGKQVPGLPSLCAPQQTLMTINGSSQDDLEFISDWIDTVALFEAAFAE
jgi:branched-chain amino acid transport system substrate-binding protein